MSEYYILDDQHKAVPSDSSGWIKWLEKNGRDIRRVAMTVVYPGCEVSTVFLGLNHSFVDGPPLIFETMVFGGPFDQDQDRYSTWDEAIAGHARLVDKCQPILTEQVQA